MPVAAERPKVGKRIKSLRDERGLTQQELATAAGLSLSVLSKLEQDKKGRTDPRVSTLVAIAKALGVPVTRLIEE